MEMNREKMLKEVMAADFTVIDLNLYLDTHPNDARTISLFNNSVKRAIALRNQYECMYGPLTAFCSLSTCPWQWIKSPWPWEG